MITAWRGRVHEPDGEQACSPRRRQDRLTQSTWTPRRQPEDDCPGCGATHGARPKPAPPKVAAETCTVCGLSIAGSLPTPQLRTAVLLVILRTEVTRRSGKDPAP